MAKNFSRAFTLIELLVVIAIVAILAAIAYPVFTGVLERAKVTKDMNNLRQIGIATQLYMNDNDGALPGSATVAWMAQLHQTKYLSSWNVFQSPFDTRAPFDDPANANSPVSYGINGNPTNSVIGAAADKIVKPSEFILFGPAQAAGTTVTFSGLAGTPTPYVTVYKNASNPSGPATGGIYGSRKMITALFADLHVEAMAWTVFIDDTNPSPNYRWDAAGK
jgi:prepilin-type N-terminal cleavage/methylation domain-containing protein